MANIDLPSDEHCYAKLTPDGGGTSLLDLDVDGLIALYKEHGALLIRGFDFDVDVFRPFAMNFCSQFVFNDSPGRGVVDKENEIQTVNLGASRLPLHPELSREPYKPDTCMFACVSPATVGGETVICDGVEVVNRMEPELRAEAEGRRLLYTREATPQEAGFWLRRSDPSDEDLGNPPDDCPYAFRRDGDRILCSFSRPFLHKPMFAASPAWGNFLIYARTIYNVYDYPTFEDGSPVPRDLVDTVEEITEEIREPVRWQARDVLLLDNTRFMHGRNRIGDPGNRRIVTLFGYLNFAAQDPEEGAAPRWRDADGLSGLFAQ